jgi:glycosyltransferase involved in cell wall biosynthesis
MHVMFIHPNFPAQFGHIAQYLSTHLGWTCTFVTSIDTRHLELPFVHINYQVYEGPKPKVFNNPESLQVLLDHALAVYKGLRSVPEVRPDLVVGHMSYGTMLYLRNLYSCAFVGYYELLPPPFWTNGMVLRPEWPPTEGVRLFNATFHALTYLHLHTVDAGYTPTHFQLGTAPKELQHKLRVIFDGVDADGLKRRPLARPLTFRGVRIGPKTKVVTYVSRGLESVRGFDIFMKVAKRIGQQISDVVFLIAGQERTEYGYELQHLQGKSFKQHVLSQEQYDLERIHFLGLIPMSELVTLFSLSDLHVYLTVPYVLSWSMIQAMAAGCTVLGSATPPVQEAIDDGVQGVLRDFYDVEGLAEQALQLLGDSERSRLLGENARARALERYDQKKCLGQLVEFFTEVANKNPPPAPPLSAGRVVLSAGSAARLGSYRRPGGGRLNS